MQSLGSCAQRRLSITAVNISAVAVFGPYTAYAQEHARIAIVDRVHTIAQSLLRDAFQCFPLPAECTCSQHARTHARPSQRVVHCAQVPKVHIGAANTPLKRTAALRCTANHCGGRYSEVSGIAYVHGTAVSAATATRAHLRRNHADPLDGDEVHLQSVQCARESTREYP